MKRQIVIFVVLGGLFLSFTALALSSPTVMTVPWWTIDGGGGTSVGGQYAVSGTIGQPDAQFSHGGDWSAAGGFWVVPEGGKTVYLPLVIQP